MTAVAGSWIAAYYYNIVEIAGSVCRGELVRRSGTRLQGRPRRWKEVKKLWIWHLTNSKVCANICKLSARAAQGIEEPLSWSKRAEKSSWQTGSDVLRYSSYRESGGGHNWELCSRASKKVEKSWKKFLTNAWGCDRIKKFERAKAKREHFTVPCKLNNVKTN